jgi:hypothetical protein
MGTIIIFNNNNPFVGFEVSKAVTVEIPALLNVTSCIQKHSDASEKITAAIFRVHK